MQFARRCSSEHGLSSTALWTSLYHGDLRYAKQSHALDFDDWCRCLHKMSLFPVSVLAKGLRDLQTTDPAYAFLLFNLAQSVYICLLYWCVPVHALTELCRRASLGRAEYAELLTVNGMCTAKDWSIVPSRTFPWHRHNPSCARVFCDSYRALVSFEFEPDAQMCCLILPRVPACIRTLRRMWERHVVVRGERADNLRTCSKICGCKV